MGEVDLIGCRAEGCPAYFTCQDKADGTASLFDAVPGPQTRLLTYGHRATGLDDDIVAPSCFSIHAKTTN